MELSACLGELPGELQGGLSGELQLAAREELEGDEASPMGSTFASAREEASAREDEASNEASRCGTTRHAEVPAANNAHDTTWQYTGFKVECGLEGRGGEKTRQGPTESTAS